MNILVEKYRVRHNGKKYKAGDVIQGIPAEEAEKLVKESHGSLRLLNFHNDMKNVATETETAAKTETAAEEISGLPDESPTIVHRKGGKK